MRRSLHLHKSSLQSGCLSNHSRDNNLKVIRKKHLFIDNT